MEIERKYFNKKQIEILGVMKKGVWYSAYEITYQFKIKNPIQCLMGLFRKDVVDLREEDKELNGFFSNNIHRQFKLKDKFKLVENQPSSWFKKGKV